MSEIMIKDLYNMNETIAAELFDGLTYPWEALPKIGEFIKKLGETLDPEEYDKVGEGCVDRKIHQRISVRICTWTGDHRKKTQKFVTVHLSVAMPL